MAPLKLSSTHCDAGTESDCACSTAIVNVQISSSYLYGLAAIAVICAGLVSFLILNQTSDSLSTVVPVESINDDGISELGLDNDTSVFIEWMRLHGGRVSDKISIAQFDDMGRGVVARAAINEHDELLFVPLDLIICRETIWKHAPKKLLTKYEKLRDAPTELITAFLLLEQFKDSSSRWYPYLRLLPVFPTSFRDVATPLFYESSEIINELQDERIIRAAKQERRHAKTAFTRFRRLFKNVLPADSTVSSLLEKRYLWARFLVNSRAFSMRGDRYLVPFGDIFNGKPQPKMDRQLSDGNGAQFLQYHRLEHGVGMEILADRAITRPGQQVMEDYGDNDNYVYFLYHGFIMESNPFDCTAVKLPSMADGSIAKQLVDHHAYGDYGNRLVCVTAQGTVRSSQDKQMIQLFASVSAMDDEYAEALCSVRETNQLCRSYSTDTEQDNLIVTAIQQQLQSYETSIEEDTMILSDVNTAPGLRHAIAFRVSRKQLLVSALSSLEEWSKRHTVKEMEAHSTEVTTQDDSLDQRIQRFAEWIATLNFPVNHVELKYVNPNMGYGVFATKPLTKGEIYLSVPTEVVMDAHSAMRSPFIRDLVIQSRGLNVRLTESNLLLLHLLHETYSSGHKSQWRPYLDVLPDQHRHASPLFLAPNGPELAFLQEAVPQDLYKLVREYRDRVDADYDMLKRDFPHVVDWISIDGFRWANAILDSRSIWWSGTRHLVPLLDMVNCMELSQDQAPHVTQLVDNAAVTQASTTFAQGDQVVENYAQANYIYLLYHGFVLTKNSHDCAHFRFDLDRARRLSPQNKHRQDVIAMMENMRLYSWSPDVCVGTQTQAESLDKLMLLSLIARSPQKAAELERQSKGSITPDHVDAAMQETTLRIQRLETAITRQAIAHEATLPPTSSIVTYIKQQHRLMTLVLQELEAQNH